MPIGPPSTRRRSAVLAGARSSTPASRYLSEMPRSASTPLSVPASSKATWRMATAFFTDHDPRCDGSCLEASRGKGNSGNGARIGPEPKRFRGKQSHDNRGAVAARIACAFDAAIGAAASGVDSTEKQILFRPRMRLLAERKQSALDRLGK